MKKILLTGMILAVTTLANAKADMGMLMQAQEDGNYGTALKIAKENLADVTELNGPESRSVGVAHNMIGMTLNGNQRYADATEEFLKALTIFKKSPEGNDENIMISTANLASSYEGLRQFDKALENYKIVKENRENPESAGHDKLWMVLTNMGHTYRAMKDYENSRKMYKRAYDLAPVKMQMIVFFSMLEMFEEAEQYAKAVKGYKVVLNLLIDIKDPAPAVKNSIKELREKIVDLESKIPEGPSK